MPGFACLKYLTEWRWFQISFQKGLCVRPEWSEEGTDPKSQLLPDNPCDNVVVVQAGQSDTCLLQFYKCQPIDSAYWTCSYMDLWVFIGRLNFGKLSILYGCMTFKVASSPRNEGDIKLLPFNAGKRCFQDKTSVSLSLQHIHRQFLRRISDHGRYQCPKFT